LANSRDIEESLSNLSRLAFSFSMPYLITTFFALSTLEAYQKMRKHVADTHGNVDRRFLQVMLPGHYCYNVGTRLALEETGLLEKLVQREGMRWVVKWS
jgi:hypothetical protein